jgi:hypothetical protein
MSKWKFHLYVIALGVLSSCLQSVRSQTSSPQPKSYQLSNGQWFDGKGFRRQTFYSVNGVLAEDFQLNRNEKHRVATAVIVR